MTQIQLTDPRTCYKNEFFMFCKDNPDVLFHIEMINGNGETEIVSLPAKELIFNLFFWKPLFKRDMPLLKERYLFHNEDFTSDTRMRIHTNIYNDAIELGKDTSTLCEEMIESFIEGVNNFTNIHLNEYVYSVDLLSIADTLTTPEAEKVLEFDLEPAMKKGLKETEKACKDLHKKVNQYFTRPDVHPNVFYPALKLGTLNPIQFAQMVTAVGTRTDTDESMIRRPVQGSFITGLKDVFEYCCESLTAKKSKMYNTKEMQTAQYTNRKFQLNCSAVQRIHPGFCGTNVTVEFDVTEENKIHLVGKNFLEDGQIKTFTERNWHLYVGKTLNMFSVMTCRHRDGFCHVCGGKLAEYYLPPKSVPGILAATHVMSPLVQQILSNKHMATTFATLYSIPPLLEELLVNRDNEIFFTKKMEKDELIIGIPLLAGWKLNDLKSLKGPIKNPEYFGEVIQLIIADKERINPENRFMMDPNGVVPYFSKEFLEYIRKHEECLLETPQILWIDISKFNKSLPVLSAMIFNYSTKLFVKKICDIFTDQIESYTTCRSLLETAADLIWKRVSPNIVHIEIVCRSFMVTSDTDYNMPIVTDPNNVRFKKLTELIPKRTYGTQYGFERAHDWFTSAEPFIVPRHSGPFDPLIGFVNE